MFVFACCATFSLSLLLRTLLFFISFHHYTMHFSVEPSIPGTSFGFFITLFFANSSRNELMSTTFDITDVFSSPFLSNKKFLFLLYVMYHICSNVPLLYNLIFEVK